MDIIKFGDIMFSFLDILLLFPLFALPLLPVVSRENRRLIAFLFFFTQALLITRRITNFSAAPLVIILLFIIAIFVRKIEFRKRRTDFIVLSKDEKFGIITVSDGKNTVSFNTEECALYSVGEIIRIK